MAYRTGAARALPVYAGAVLLVAGLTGLAQVPNGGANPGAQKTAGPAAEPSNPNRQPVPISTVDGVELEGTYFRGNRGRDTPCVLMIHRFGSDRSKGDLAGLATALQLKGFAVLTFDLRGHGRSTSVDPTRFWSFPANRKDVRGASPRKTTISFNDFTRNYFPMLVNDVLAARRFLDFKNDAGELNTNSILVIGFQDGAALGLLFTASEFNRAYTVGFVPLQSNGTAHNAGEDIAAGIWLSLNLRPQQGPTFNAESWIRSHPQMRDRVAMHFVFGERDTRAKRDSEDLLRVLTSRGDRNKLDGKLELKGTDLAGAALLGQPALNVSPMIVSYAEKVMAERKAIPWTKVDPEINKIGLVNLAPFGFRP
jgi:pimeloyl-ACP methyl ester carboxylesterase